MGAGGSRDTMSAQCLQQFSSTTSIPEDDAFWVSFLSIHYKTQLGALYAEENDAEIREQYDRLLVNNKESGNLPVLIRQCVQRLESRPLNRATLTEAANGIYILRTFLKFMIENNEETKVIASCTVVRTHDPVPGEDDPGPMESLLDSLVIFLATVPVNEHYLHVHVECASCLLLLLSVQLYSDQPTNTFYIYRCVMQGRSAPFAPVLVQALIQNFIQGHSPREASGSVVMDIAAGLWNMFAPRVDSDGRTDSLADLSVWLLLILTYHCTNDRLVSNPYRLPLFLFNNQVTSPELEPAQSGGTEAEPAQPEVEASKEVRGAGAEGSKDVEGVRPEPRLSVDLGMLYTCLCSTQDKEWTTLLLYTLLHGNAHVRTYFMARTDIELMIVPMLKTLYMGSSTGSYHVYMCLINLLIFSEDKLFSQTVHQVQLRNLTWFAERNIREMSLGSLIVLVLLRIIQYNIMTMRDKYLHSNCLACLANLSVHFSELHPYICQRMVDLFDILSKKYDRMRRELYPGKAEVTSKADSQVVNITPPDELLVHQYAVLEEGLRTLAEAMTSALRFNLRANPNLVYAILHKKSIFDRVRDLKEFRDVTDVIFTVLVYFNQVLNSYAQEPTEQLVQLAIAQGSLRLTIPTTAGGQEIRFRYMEEERVDQFFLPYVWSMIHNHSLLRFDSKNVQTRITD